MALLGFNNCFLSHSSRGEITCDSKRAGEDEMIKVLKFSGFSFTNLETKTLKKYVGILCLFVK